MKSANIIKVAVTDDHKLFAEGVGTLINTAKDLKTVCIASNGKELLDYIELKGMPDVILLDFEMPVMDGYDTVMELNKRYKNPKVIILSMYCNHSYIKQMLLMGVSGYLLKNAAPEEVLNAIRKVASDGLAFNDEAIIVMKNILSENDRISFFSNDFNDTEKKVIKLICLEKSTQEIAETLFLSKSTIDKIKQNLFDKMGVCSSVGIAVYAIKNKIIEI